MPEDQPYAVRAQRVARLDVRVLANRERRPSDDPCETRDATHTNRDHDILEADAKGRDDEQRKHDRGKAEHDVDHAGPDRIHRAAKESRRYEPLPRFPAVERDFSLLLAEGTPFSEVAAAIRALNIPEVISFEAADLFRVPAHD